jgi:hypothetical protein
LPTTRGIKGAGKPSRSHFPATNHSPETRYATRNAKAPLKNIPPTAHILSDRCRSIVYHYQITTRACIPSALRQTPGATWLDLRLYTKLQRNYSRGHRPFVVLQDRSSAGVTPFESQCSPNRMEFLGDGTRSSISTSLHPGIRPAVRICLDRLVSSTADYDVYMSKRPKLSPLLRLNGAEVRSVVDIWYVQIAGSRPGCREVSTQSLVVSRSFF